jgi:hypothetical protein
MRTIDTKSIVGESENAYLPTISMGQTTCTKSNSNGYIAGSSFRGMYY